ncbi:hypothetical protein P5G65_12600, partial [Paenibacillus chondroitinus]|nr:hypothetical protein [Paenibacillus chondroitinus]
MSGAEWMEEQDMSGTGWTEEVKTQDMQTRDVQTQDVQTQDVFLREYYVGVDLGGTKMLAALISGDGNIIAKEEIPTLAQQGEVAVLDRLGSLIEGLLATVPG